MAGGDEAGEGQERKVRKASHHFGFREKVDESGPLESATLREASGD
jgi:hypothetical protein